MSTLIVPQAVPAGNHEGFRLYSRAKGGMITLVNALRLVASCCLIGLAPGLLAACAAPAAAPTPSSGARLYTRTPTPTAVPATPTPTLSPQTLYRQGLARREVWDLETALERFDAALKVAHNSPAGDRGPGLAAIYTSRAELYRLAGRYDEAATDIETALALDPDLAEAWRQKALLSRAQGLWEEALNAATKLTRLQPEDGTAHALRAQIFFQGFGKARVALTNYERAIARDPSLDKATLVERWHVLEQLGRWEEALLVSHKMFSRGSEDPLRYYYRTWSLIQLGRLDEAIQMAFFGLKRYPDYPVALYYALGIAYYERKAWAEAVQALEVALLQTGTSAPETAAWRRLDITTADILGPMGVAYLELGQCETGAAIVGRADAESDAPDAWNWALKRIEACYLALTPTPTVTPLP